MQILCLVDLLCEQALLYEHLLYLAKHAVEGGVEIGNLIRAALGCAYVEVPGLDLLHEAYRLIQRPQKLLHVVRRYEHACARQCYGECHVEHKRGLGALGDLGAGVDRNDAPVGGGYRLRIEYIVSAVQFSDGISGARGGVLYFGRRDICGQVGVGVYEVAGAVDYQQRGVSAN